MTDVLLILGLLAAWVAALCLMSRWYKPEKIERLVPIMLNDDGIEEHEVYDPSQDPEKIMKADGEIESYFD